MLECRFEGLYTFWYPFAFEQVGYEKVVVCYMFDQFSRLLRFCAVCTRFTLPLQAVDEGTPDMLNSDRKRGRKKSFLPKNCGLCGCFSNDDDPVQHKMSDSSTNNNNNDPEKCQVTMRWNYPPVDGVPQGQSGDNYAMLKVRPAAFCGIFECRGGIAGRASIICVVLGALGRKLLLVLLENLRDQVPGAVGDGGEDDRQRARQWR